MKWRHSRSSRDIEQSMEQIWRTKRFFRGDIFHLRSGWWVRADWQQERGKNFPGSDQHTWRWSSKGGIGSIENSSKTFYMDKVDRDKLTHLVELSHSAFCILSLLVQDNFLERRLLFKKLTVLKRTLRILSSMHCLQYNYSFFNSYLNLLYLEKIYNFKLILQKLVLFNAYPHILCFFK